MLFLFCGFVLPVFSYVLLYISLRSRGVVITRRPTSALSLVPSLLVLLRLQCAGEIGASSGPLLIALTFPDYVDYFSSQRRL